MADDRIEVVFSAEFGDLVAGVQQVTGAITSLTAPVQTLGTTFTGTFSQVEKTVPAGAAATGKEWQSALEVIDRSLDTMLKGVLQGTQTWQTAMARLFSNLAVSFIEAVAKMMVQWAAFEALTAVVGSGNSPIANPFGSGAGGGGGAGGLGGLVGMALGGLGHLIGFASGSWSVPADMLAVVHQGEMILPANTAATLRAGAASGDNAAAGAGSSFALNVSVQAMDAAGVAQWANANAKTLATTIARYMNGNPSARGDY